MIKYLDIYKYQKNQLKTTEFITLEEAKKLLKEKKK